MNGRREVIVHGTPVSVNSHGPKYNRWKQRVSDSAYESISDDMKLDSLSYPRVAVLIAHFHQSDSRIDLDNIAKGILDGICGPMLSDDSQITELVLRRIALQRYRAVNASRAIVVALSRAVDEESEFVLVRAQPDEWNGEL